MTVSKANPPSTTSVISLPAMSIPESAALASAVGIAILAQVFISIDWLLPGVLAYLATGIILLRWIHRNPETSNLLGDQVQLSRRGEYILLGLLVAVTIGLRFFDLEQRVYGIEGDESTWTVQSWYSTILQVDRGEFAELHYEHLPVDFWVRSIFLRLFGLNFISARIESSTLGLLSVSLLYLLVRGVTSSSSSGLLAALLYSFSFAELSASHQALHNTVPAAWSIAAFVALFAALRHRKWWQFQAAGILFALGMLTYETFYPNCILGVAYLLGFAIHELRQKRNSPRDWIAPLFVTAWPMAMVFAVFTREYINEREYYLLGQLQGSFLSADGSLVGPLQYFWGNSLNVLKVTFSRIIWGDSLVEWDGPLVNPLLLPFVLLGFAHNLSSIRRPHFAFIPLWYLFHAFSGPILLGSAWPRVMYLGMAPLFVWAALGLWMGFAALRVLFTAPHSKTAVAAFALALCLLVGNDYYVFRYKLVDLELDRERRELADITTVTASENPSSMLLFPYMAEHRGLLARESHVLSFSVAGARDLGLEAFNDFKQLNMAQLLQELWQLRDRDGVDVVYDKVPEDFKEESEEFLNVILRCYDGTEIAREGQYFEVYHFDRQALQSPRCYSPPPSVHLAPEDGSRLGEQSQSPTFRWNTDGVASTSFELIVQRKREDTYWIEAEDEFQDEGWTLETGFARDYSGAGFILDAWKAGEASYSFANAHAGEYRLWVRYDKRIDSGQRNMAHVNGDDSEFGGDGTPLNEWRWESVGVYDLPAGPIPIAFTRTYDVEGHYSLFIDAIVITADLDLKPDLEDSVWERVVSTGEIRSNASQYSVTENLPPGEYRWRVRIFDGDRLIDPTGARGVEGAATRFFVP